MNCPLVCLCLNAKTLQGNLELIDNYRKWIDIAELRVDHLDTDEQLHIRRFPEQAGLPCILTIRRKIDGGLFFEGEANRTTLFARGLAFANQDRRKNFAYVDFEEDFYVPSLQEAAFAFGTRVIRSYHDMTGCLPDTVSKLKQMKITGYEIPKISCMPHSLSEVTRLFQEAKELENREQILVLMGDYGFPSRILADKLHSFLTYTSPEGSGLGERLGHIDPKTLSELYRFQSINTDTAIYGVTGFPLKTTLSPLIHNTGYIKHGINAVYIPIKSETIEETLGFAEAVGIQGISVTVPHKERVLSYLNETDGVVKQIKACNTILKTPSGWTGYDTDLEGLSRALLEFLQVKNLSGVKAAIIGAGGAAKAAALAVKRLKGKACVFNRTIGKAKHIADNYKFHYASLTQQALPALEQYSNLIIQTTPVGMNADPLDKSADPLSFYYFTGNEAVFDVIYTPEMTPVLTRAKKAGCRVCNGRSMLDYQGYEQFKIFTGESYETVYTG
ncbi:MAG: type I 3-dehydroquinate dehydratase [Treponema sp.]|jgi:3-dehydroquinate dehydratase/shikimate dehydrogenase|nr:type I 3-dehydroquinate dehydratase [Treponema sp.]